MIPCGVATVLNEVGAVPLPSKRKVTHEMIYTTLAFLGPIGWPEILVLLILGLLIFGKRLPEVGKSLGQGIVEFKKGLSGVEDEIEKASRQAGKSEKPSPPPQLEEDKTDEELRTSQTAEHSSTHGA